MFRCELGDKRWNDVAIWKTILYMVLINLFLLLFLHFYTHGYSNNSSTVSPANFEFLEKYWRLSLENGSLLD